MSHPFASSSSSVWSGLVRLKALGGGLGLVVAIGACRGGSNASPPVVSNAQAAEPKTAPSVRPAMALPMIRVVLDDPRLSRARDLDRAKDPAGALRAMREARPVDLAASERCAWDYVEGRLAVAAGALAEAQAAFELAQAPACPLAGYATLRLSQAHARGGRADEAFAARGSKA